MRYPILSYETSYSAKGDTRYSAKESKREVEICKQQDEIKMRHATAIDRFRFMGVRVEKSIGIDD